MIDDLTPPGPLKAVAKERQHTIKDKKPQMKKNESPGKRFRFYQLGIIAIIDLVASDCPSVPLSA